MLRSDIGINAGVIWQILSEKGMLSIREIGEITGYAPSMLFSALGWLAREDKVAFSNRGETLYIELIHSYTENFY